MDELLPSAWLTGMDDPLRWMRAVAARLSVRPPCSPAQWLPPRARLAALRWYEPLGHELVTVHLFAQTDRVEIGIWTTAWSNDQVGYWMYHELVITMATLIIDQYADQEGPPIQVAVQPYAETQAPLRELED
jgi:hypothetical protein